MSHEALIKYIDDIEEEATLIIDPDLVYIDEIQNIIEDKKLKIYKSKDPLNLYLSICDASMSLGLFKTDGSFDQNRILISDNPHSHIWARELFEHVKQQVV